MDNDMKQLVKIIGGVVLAALILMICFGSFYTVDQGERAVITRNGAVIGSSTPGFNFKMPIIDAANKISIREFTINYEDVHVYSRDIQGAVTNWSVTFRADPTRVEHIYEAYRTAHDAVTTILDPRFADRVKAVFGQYNAVSIIANRAELTSKTFDLVREALEDSGLIVTGVQLENIDFSKEYERSIEQRMTAEVEVERIRQNLEREKVQADIVRTQASAQADQVREQANAEAERIQLIGQAEAEAIRLRGQALANNPDLIRLIQAEKWNGTLPTTMVPGSTVPFLNLE